MRVASRQASGDRGENAVAGDVAERVVDQPEGVDVDVQQGDAGAGAARAGQRELEVLLEQRAVREPGQRIAEGQLEADARARLRARACRSSTAALAASSSSDSVVSHGPVIG